MSSAPTDSKGIALITGAARGIGRSIALRLAADGYDIALNDIQSTLAALQALEEEIKGLGRRVCVCVADVSVEEEVRGMVEKCVEELGGVDVMVANAGVVLWKPFLETSTDEWTRLFAINVTGAMLCFRYAGDQMVKQGRGGRLLAACSVAGKRGTQMAAAYCASKFAVRGMVQSVALSLGPHGITVNAYAPGAIDTDMLKSMDDAQASYGAPTGALVKGLASRTALGKTGEVKDVAALVAFLVSKEAGFITGQSVCVDGGLYFD